jgi:hypothetical protein
MVDRTPAGLARAKALDTISGRPSSRTARQRFEIKLKSAADPPICSVGPSAITSGICKALGVPLRQCHLRQWKRDAASVVRCETGP